MTTEQATFGAGCFWGVEETFRQVDGVISTEVGYTGGSVGEPTYKDVCGGKTGHAEVVRVDFDPGRVGYAALLETFWTCHDPTQQNRQGPDVGTQYRTAIFVHSAQQEAAAKTAIAALEASGRFKKPIATEVVAAGPFFRAEDYHQRYLQKRGLPACGLD